MGVSKSTVDHYAGLERIAKMVRHSALQEAEAIIEAQRLAFVRNDAERAWEQALDAAVRDIRAVRDGSK